VLPALAVTLQFAIHRAAQKWHLVVAVLLQAAALKSLHLVDRDVVRDQAAALKSLHLADQAVALKPLVHQLAAVPFARQSLMPSKA